MTEEEARATLERIRNSARPRILFVTHGDRGGVARHVAGLAEALSADAEVLVLRPHASGLLRLARPGETLEIFFDPEREWEALLELLDALGVGRLHFHHVDGLPRHVLGLPERLGVPHDVTLHDYYPACPNYHLTAGDGRYCGGHPTCQRCLEAHPSQWKGSVEDWRAAFRPFMQQAARVIAPSEDTARRIASFFPGCRVVTWPHPESPPMRTRVPARVLVPGAISLAKGMDLLEACVADAKERDLPLHFRVLGFVARKLPVWPDAPVSICGEFPEGRLDELIALERGDVLFFPSQCPETFSYTLSSALDSGLPVVATDLGALPERLRASGSARIMPWTSSPAALNDALLELAGPRPRAAAERERTSFEAYKERYLAQPARSRAQPPQLPALALRVEPPWIAPQRLPLAYLYEDGVICGKASSLEGLRRYAFDPDSLYADVDARVRELIEARAAQATTAEEAQGPRGVRALVRWLRDRFA